MVEMDVCDERHGHLRFDAGQRCGGFFIRHRDANQFASGRLKLPNLLDRRRDIPRIGRTHRLDGDRRIAADLDFADLNLPGFASRNVHRKIWSA